MMPSTSKQRYLLAAFLFGLQWFCPVYAGYTTAQDNRLSDDDAQVIFNLAMAERDNGKIYHAIERFEYILSRRPSLNRARLELAVSYHRTDQYDKALHEFQTVLDDPTTPEKVQLAILAYLGQLTNDELKPKTEHHFSFYTKIGLLYNSNINFAPLRGSLDFNIANGEDIQSSGFDTFLSASHRYKDAQPFNVDGATTHFEWQSQISWTGNNYTRKSDFNVNIISVSTGPAFISTGRWRGAINLQLDQVFFGDASLATFASLNPLLTFDLGDYRGITLETSFTDNNFSRSEDKGRDGNRVLAGAAYSALLDGINNGLETGFRITRLSADDKQFAYDSREIYLGGFIAYNTSSSFYLNLNVEQFNFDDADTVSGKVRREIESHYVLGYNYDFSAGPLANWTFNTQASFTKNNANVDAFSYERTLFAINLARYFI